MNPYQKAVGDFMRVMEQPVPTKPTLDNYPFILRVKLILEEALEFAEASRIWVSADNDGDMHFSAPGDKTHDEEFGLNESIDSPPDMVAMIDALCDILYVAFGAAEAMGVDLDDFFAEVQASNMRKLGTDGKPIRRLSDRKVLKPDGWEPPDLSCILARHKERVR